eukprot:7358746-Pyramimonas_sp.AAC.1
MAPRAARPTIERHPPSSVAREAIHGTGLPETIALICIAGAWLPRAPCAMQPAQAGSHTSGPMARRRPRSDSSQDTRVHRNAASRRAPVNGPVGGRSESCLVGAGGLLL